MGFIRFEITHTCDVGENPSMKEFVHRCWVTDDAYFVYSLGADFQIPIKCQHDFNNYEQVLDKMKKLHNFDSKVGAYYNQESWDEIISYIDDKYYKK